MIVKWSLRFSAFIALLAIALLIAVLYLPETSKLGQTIVNGMGGDRTVHVLVGALIPISLAYLARLYLASKRLQWAFWFACLSLFVADEFVQGFSPVRSSDLSDLAMSALGWIIGCSCWWLLWLVTHKEH